MPGKLLTCPYNMAHQIRPERMQYHLIKCRKNFPEMSLVICPYNATHQVQQTDEHKHLMTCPDRRIVEIQKYRFNEPMPGQHGDLTNPIVYGSSIIPPEVDGVEIVRPDRLVQDSFLDETSASSIGVANLRKAAREHYINELPGEIGIRREREPIRGTLMSRNISRDQNVFVPPSAIPKRPPRELGSPTASPDQSITVEEEEDDDDDDDFKSLTSEATSGVSRSLWVKRQEPYKPLRRPKSSTLSNTSSRVKYDILAPTDSGCYLKGD